MYLGVLATVNNTVANTPKYIISNGTVSYLYGDRTGGFSLYEMNNTTAIATDKTNKISSSGSGKANLLAYFAMKGAGSYLLYGMDGNIRSVLASDLSADASVLPSALSSTNAFGTNDWCVGADLNFYFTSTIGH